MPLSNKSVSKIKEQTQYCEGVREVLGFIGDKWSVLIIVILNDGPRRFNELKSSIDGISQRMLTRNLRTLERSGILNRTVEPSVPPSVHYALTPLGKTLIKPMQTIAEWAYENYQTIQNSHKAYDQMQNDEKEIHNRRQ